MRLRYTREASADIDSIYTYILHDNPVAAMRVVGRIRQVIEYLATFPFAGHAGTVPDTSELSVSGLPYIVVYEVSLGDANEIVILRILHGAQERGGQGSG